MIILVLLHMYSTQLLYRKIPIVTIDQPMFIFIQLFQIYQGINFVPLY